jgi:hypothetical protein
MLSGNSLRYCRAESKEGFLEGVISSFRFGWEFDYLSDVLLVDLNARTLRIGNDLDCVGRGPHRDLICALRCLRTSAEN